MMSEADIIEYNKLTEQLELLKKDDKSFKQGLQEYAKDDWPLLLDRLHIPQDEIKQKLSDFLATI